MSYVATDPDPISVAATGDLAARYSALPILHTLDAAALTALMGDVARLSVPGGWRLFSQGDVGDALYIVLSGRLRVMAEALGRNAELVAEVGPGETIGEMALVSGEPRSATAIAVRDTEVLRLDRADFERLAVRHPAILAPITVLLAQRLKRMTEHSSAAHPPRTLAFIPLAAAAPCEALTARLAHAFKQMPLRVCALDPAAAGKKTEWYHAVEAAHDLTLYRGEAELSAWTRLCLRQADRVVLVTSPLAPPEHWAQLRPMLMDRPARSVDLILVQAASKSGEHDIITRDVGVQLCHRTRIANDGDIARLARLLTNRAVGLVLSGGGARGLAHVGVIRALRHAGLPIDLVGGASMGAIIAAGVALEWDDGELRNRLREAFVETNPLSDITVPLVALFKGRKVTRLLQRCFGESRIEELRHPYFCVSSNLTTSQTMVHRVGPLWRALRASIAIPGMLPPVIENGEVLVDGGILNNLPADVMRAMERGPVIGVDVAANRALTSIDLDLEKASLLRLLCSGRRQVPWILRTLARAGTVSSNFQAASFRQHADVLLAPPLASVDLLDWAAFDRIVEIGYRHTMSMLEREEGALLRYRL